MAETYSVVTKVWIAPGCIVCDSCENDCPEVFDVQEETCLIRPPAQSADFLAPLSPSIITAMEGCPVEVIKIETKQVEGKAPWADAPAGEPAAAGAGVVAQAKAPAKAVVPQAPPDPKWQALLTTSKISPSLSASITSTIRKPSKSQEVAHGEEIVRAARLPKDAPPDQRAAMLAIGGAYQPVPSMAQRIRDMAAKAGAPAKASRRQFNIALAVGWGMLAIVGATFGAMFQDFFGPKALKEPKKQFRLDKLAAYSNPGVYEYKTLGGSGFWLVNLTPSEDKLIALSVICTHLGCIPDWKPTENKYKCPCHGSGYYMNGINFEGPTPRPLERFSIFIDPDGYVTVDKTKVFRYELGQWDSPESFVAL